MAKKESIFKLFRRLYKAYRSWRYYNELAERMIKANKYIEKHGKFPPPGWFGPVKWK